VIHLQAVVIDEYGAADQLHIAEIEKPQPGEREVLVKVHAASINPVDWKIRRGDLRLLLRKTFPRIVGIDFAGVIDSVGSAVKGFAPGDAVFGLANPIRSHYGSYAQFVIAEKDSIAKKPEGLSFVEAASIPVAGLTALRALRTLMNLQAGQKVLVNGASGGVGTFAIQIAKVMGATVTAVCSDANMQFVRDLGADEVYDYRIQEVTKLDDRFHGVFDVTANLSFSEASKLLKRNGTYVTTVPTAENILAAVVTSVLPGKRARVVLASGGATSTKELSYLADLVVSGKIKTIVSRTISMPEVAEAHRTAEHGHNRGKIVIQIG
jgi:NADPH:quinone reductase-like Zn-dependent oxidoreductase